MWRGPVLLMLALASCGAHAQAPPRQPPASAIATLLGASAELGTMLEPTPWVRELPDVEDLQAELQRIVRCDYPTDSPAALAARRELLVAGAAIVPDLVAQLAACDVATWPGRARMSFADRLLEELCHGGFESVLSTSAEAVRANRDVIASWRELCARTQAHPGFWSGRAGVSQAQLDALVEGLPSSFRPCEVAMTAGMRVRAATGTGTITVESDGGFRRSYAWAGGVRWAQLDRATPGFTRSELCFPGPGDHWEPLDGITRGVLDEGRKDFDSVDQALAWIELERTDKSLVYGTDGVVVALDRSPQRRQLNVDVWQLRIDGKVPSGLRGGDDDACRVSR